MYGGVQDHTVDLAGPVRQFAAVHAILNVGCQDVVEVLGNLAPEDAQTVGNVRDSAARRDVERQYTREHVVVAADVGTERQIVGRCPVADPTTLNRSIDSGHLSSVAPVQAQLVHPHASTSRRYGRLLPTIPAATDPICRSVSRGRMLWRPTNASTYRPVWASDMWW